MKIITTMKIVEIPEADLIEEDNGRILIHFHGGEFPATYTLESLTIFRDALTAMIDHLSGETGPDRVWDNDGDMWFRNPDGTYRLQYVEDNSKYASVQIETIRKECGITEDQS